MIPSIHLILVPQGAEHRAICQGLKGATHAPMVLPVPVGPAPLTRHLQKLHESKILVAGQRILVMGVCGGLVSNLSIGDRVLYQSCATNGEKTLSLDCDRELTAQIRQHLMGQIRVVQAVTSDRVVATPVDKQTLAQQFKAEVVDMEGYAALSLLQSWGIAVAMVRVVSDSSQHAIPDLSSAFDANGSLRPLVLAQSLVRQPIAGVQLIQGSLKGITKLRLISKELFL